jgi:hypothetical protein
MYKIINVNFNPINLIKRVRLINLNPLILCLVRVKSVSLVILLNPNLPILYSIYIEFPGYVKNL